MIYFVQLGFTGAIKIGTSKTFTKRFRSLRSFHAGIRLNVLGVLPGGFEEEAQLHRRFATDGKKGEWFWPTPDLLRFIFENARPWVGFDDFPAEIPGESPVRTVSLMGPMTVETVSAEW